MPSYEISKIYKITNDINDKIYIGSSTYQYLANRMNIHRQNVKDNTSRRNSPLNNEMRLLGVEHFKIELIEKFPCNNKDELREREQYYIELLKPELNKFRANRDPKFEENEIIRKKKYYEDNKDLCNTRDREWYNKNKEKIAENGKIKFTCDCGTTCRVSDKLRHCKSKKHIEYTSNIKIFL